MEVARKSIWARFLLVRLAAYSAASSILVTGLEAFMLWNLPRIGIDSTEMRLRDLASTAFGVFWIVLLSTSTILGTLHFFISLVEYRRVASRGDREDTTPESSSNAVGGQCKSSQRGSGQNQPTTDVPISTTSIVLTKWGHKSATDRGGEHTAVEQHHR